MAPDSESQQNLDWKTPSSCCLLKARAAFATEEVGWGLTQLNLKTSKDGDPSVDLGPTVSVFHHPTVTFCPFYNQVELLLLQHVLIGSCLLCPTPPRTALLSLLCSSPMCKDVGPHLVSLCRLNKLGFRENWFVLFHLNSTSTSSSTFSSLRFLCCLHAPHPAQPLLHVHLSQPRQLYALSLAVWSICILSMLSPSSVLLLDTTSVFRSLQNKPESLWASK